MFFRLGGEKAASKAILFLESITRVFWHIHGSQPKKTTVATVVQLQEFLPLETAVQGLIAVIHAVMVSDEETIPVGVKLYSKFVCSRDQIVAQAAKNAILKTLRPKDSSVRFAAQSPAQKSSQQPGTTERTQQQQRDALEAAHSAMVANVPEMDGAADSDDNEDQEQNFAVEENDVASQNVEDMLGELQLVWQMVEPHLGAQQLDDFIENPEQLQQVS